MALNSFRLIVFKGKGVPDVNTRLMLKKLHNVLRIPVLALVDGDPHGTDTEYNSF